MTTLEDQFRTAVADHRAGRLAEAEAGYRVLIAAQPDLLVAHQNLVALLRAQNRVGDLEPAYRALLALAPSDWLRFALGATLLHLGRYAEGWPLYEYRPVKAAARPQGARPEWLGEPLAGKSILVCQEQGLGDQIQMGRYIPLLQAQGARVQFACTAPLMRLFEPFCETVLIAPELRGRWDYWASSMSLPLRFATTLETIPPPLPIASRSGGSGIGVVTEGGPANSLNAYRSLPPDQAAALMAALPGAVSLDPALTGVADLQGTAEIISGLSAVVSVCTATAHLAASMGKPTFILLSADWADWRWLRDRQDSPWYPSAHLVRQPTQGDWPGAIAQLLRAMERA